jgi:hypothetical protein
MRSDPASPLHKDLEELLDMLFRGLVGKIARRIKSLRGISNHGLGRWYWARAVPVAPTEAPMIVAGFPDHALSP